MIKYFRQLASESLVYGLAGTMTRFITIFLVPLYTRALTPEDYGVVSLIRNTTALIVVFASLALDSAAHRFYWDKQNIADQKSTIASWTWSWLVLSTLVSLIVALQADALGPKLSGKAGTADSLRLAALTVPLGVLGIVFMNRLRMQRRPWAVTAYTLVTALMSVLLAALLVLILRWGVHGVFLSQFIASLITTPFVVVLLGDWINPRRFDWRRLTAMLRYSLPLIPGVVSWWVIDVIDRYFLHAYSTTTEIGLYEIGYSIAAVVALGTSAFQLAWTPFALSIQDHTEARQIYAHTLVAFAWIGTLACAGATLLAPEALRLLTTNAYYGASSVVPFLAFSYFFLGAAYITSLGLIVKKQTVSMGMAITIAALLNIALNFGLVPHYGKDGAALATLLAYMFVPIYLYYRSQRVYPIPFRFSKFVAIVLFAVAIISVGGSWRFQNIWLGIFAKLGLLSLFFPLLFVIRIITFAQVSSFIRTRLAWSGAQ